MKLTFPASDYKEHWVVRWYPSDARCKVLWKFLCELPRTKPIVLCWFFHCNCNWWWTIYHSTRLPIFLLSVYDPTKLKEGWNNAFRCDKILMLVFCFPCLPCNFAFEGKIRTEPFIWQTSWAKVSIARNSIVSETPNFKALHCCAVYLWPLRLWLLIIPN